MSDDEDSTPAKAQRLFGAGLQKKGIDFVRAGSLLSTRVAQRDCTTSSIGDKYLSIVFKDAAPSKDSSTTYVYESEVPRGLTQQQSKLKISVCEVCNLPIDSQDDAVATVSRPHESSMAHQICLENSHPPSHLDRNRQGLKYLSSYGWDPDSRLGLGASGEGIRVPIKVKEKTDTVGLGIELKGVKAPQGKVVNLDAKQTRKSEMADRKKRERLQEMFYGNDDMEKYLGGG